MKRNIKVGLLSTIAVVVVIAALALATHARESAEDAGTKAGTHENETALQALSETLNNNGTAKSTQGESRENQTTEAGEASGQ